MQPMIEDWLGEQRPKQFCRFVGRRSMLEHSWIRARQVATVRKMVTVVGDSQMDYLRELNYAVPGAVVSQPQLRGTAAGILLPLAAILAKERNAVVHILPSDHFVLPNAKFVAHLRQAERVIREQQDKVVLTAAVPDCAEADFGWIAPGEPLRTAADHPVFGVVNFREKPDQEQAERYLRRGFLWNTMITTARASTLWQLASSHLPEVLWPFEQLRSALRNPDSTRAEMRANLARAYETLPERDFSRDLLESIGDRSLVMPLRGVAWSDWGRPERVRASIERHGLRRNFPSTPDPQLPSEWGTREVELPVLGRPA